MKLVEKRKVAVNSIVSRFLKTLPGAVSVLAAPGITAVTSDRVSWSYIVVGEGAPLTAGWPLVFRVPARVKDVVANAISNGQATIRRGRLFAGGYVIRGFRASGLSLPERYAWSRVDSLEAAMVPGLLGVIVDRGGWVYAVADTRVGGQAWFLLASRLRVSRPAWVVGKPLVTLARTVRDSMGSVPPVHVAVADRAAFFMFDIGGAAVVARVRLVPAVRVPDPVGAIQLAPRDARALASLAQRPVRATIKGGMLAVGGRMFRAVLSDLDGNSQYTGLLHLPLPVAQLVAVTGVLQYAETSDGILLNGSHLRRTVQD